MDRGAWWATVHGVTISWTWLKRLSAHTHSTQGNNTEVFWEWMIHIWFEKSGKASTWSVFWKKISDRQRRNGKVFPRRKQYETSIWLCATGQFATDFLVQNIVSTFESEETAYNTGVKWSYLDFQTSQFILQWWQIIVNLEGTIWEWADVGHEQIFFPQIHGSPIHLSVHFLGPNVTFSKLPVTTQILLSDDLVPAEFFCLSC